jgi:hypothetical protein
MSTYTIAINGHKMSTYTIIIKWIAISTLLICNKTKYIISFMVKDRRWNYEREY